MFSPRGQPNDYPLRGGSNYDSPRRQQQQRRRSSSSFFSLGNSTGKRISLLFAILNFLALLQYRYLMSRTLEATTKQYDDESMMGGYHSHMDVGIGTKTSGTIEARRQMSTELSSDIGSGIVAPQISTNATKVHDSISQRMHMMNERSNLLQNIPASVHKIDKPANSGKFAYFFLIGGAMSKKKGTDYRGGLYGVVVAAHNLRRQGSKADVILMVQVSATTNATKLPELEEELLQAMNIRVVYLPKYSHPTLESFYSLMMEKFRVLLFEEYSRVLYLDADVLPLCNLDYMMELSESGELLQENVVLAYKGEPASGGFFVLKPSAADYRELIEIVRKTESKYLELEYPHWDPIEGWGHIIEESDPWKTTKWKNGTNWTFYGAQADQGLLYYWTKYYKKSASIIRGNILEQWGTDSETGHLRLLNSNLDALEAHVCVDTGRRKKGWISKTPYMNFVHFTGNGKPWNYDRTVFEKQLNRIKNKTNMNNYGDYEYWYWLLQDALEKTDFKHKVSLDFITSERKQPSVGKTPSFDQRAQYMRRKAYNGWRQYEYEERDISQMIDEVSTDLSTAGDIIRKSIVDGEGMGTKLPPSSLSTESGLEAKDLVNMLEHFQPRTALKPFLPQLKKIQDDLDSSSSFDALASSSLQNSDTTAETSLLHDEATDPRRWAYAFLLGGARSNREGTEYLTGLYSVVASAYQIRKLGSKADVILMVQIAAESPHRKLMESEEEILQKMDIKIVYVPKFADASLECFYSLMMEKFRILKLTDYSRVMYLDYDVMPTCNLDYLFELSDPLPDSSGSTSNYNSFRLKENVILAYQREPSSGGIFILKPNSTDYEHIQRIIYEKENRVYKLPYPHWDPEIGWGHVITPPDYWKSVRGRIGTNWTWYGVEADQGLLYYWTKYVKKSVSIIVRDDLEQWDADNWETDINGSLVLRPRPNGVSNVTTVVKKAFKSHGCPVTHFLPAPYNDFFHMTGRAKPWFQTKEQLENPDCTLKHERECRIQALWYRLLKEALNSINVLDRFSWDFLGTGKIGSLGLAPTNEQIAMYMMAKIKRNWNQYEEDVEQPLRSQV